MVRGRKGLKILRNLSKAEPFPAIWMNSQKKEKSATERSIKNKEAMQAEGGSVEEWIHPVSGI
jgi:hypothetical protein